MAASSRSRSDRPESRGRPRDGDVFGLPAARGWTGAELAPEGLAFSVRFLGSFASRVRPSFGFSGAFLVPRLAFVVRVEFVKPRGRSMNRGRGRGRVARLHVSFERAFRKPLDLLYRLRVRGELVGSLPRLPLALPRLRCSAARRRFPVLSLMTEGRSPDRPSRNPPRPFRAGAAVAPRTYVPRQAASVFLSYDFTRAAQLDTRGDRGCASD